MKITIETTRDHIGNLSAKELLQIASNLVDDAESHPVAIIDYHTPQGRQIGTLSVEFDEDEE